MGRQSRVRTRSVRKFVNNLNSTNYEKDSVSNKDLGDVVLAKWSHFCEIFGCRSAMNNFYVELDEDLKNALVDYAINVYGPRGMKTTYEKYCNA